MSTTLSPILRRKIQQLGSRRSFLLGTRGICIALCCAIAAMGGAVLVDYLWLVEGTNRWILSLTFYLFAAVAIILGFFIPMRKKLSTSDLASLFEEREPRLKEKVLPAVQLGSAANNGSAAFRHQVILQADNAIQQISVSKLLPLNLINRWIWGATILVVGIFATLSIPGGNIGQHIARILLPAANLGRPSATKIQIIAPLADGKTLAPNEVISFEILVDRPQRWKGRPVELEFLTADKLRTTHVLSFREGQNPTVSNSAPETFANRLSARTTESYSINQTLDQATQFRFRADGAATPWTPIEIKPRPTVQYYRRTLDFPDYADVPSLEIESETGDVSAVAGTKLKLSVQTDQALSDAQLLWQDSQSGEANPKVVPMSGETDTLWTYSTELTQNALYRFNGTGKTTQLESAIGKRQRITVVSDQPPTTRWIQPTTSQRTTSTQALLNFEMQIADEFPLAEINFLIRVDRKNWETVKSLPCPEFFLQQDIVRHSFSQSWALDLLDFQLSEGQLLEVKTVAVDRFGQTTQSPVLAYLLSGVQLDTTLPPNLLERITLVSSAREFGQQMRDLTSVEDIHQWQADPANTDQQNLVESVRQFVQRNQKQTQLLGAKIQHALQSEMKSAVADQYERSLEYLRKSALEDSATLDNLLDSLSNLPEDQNSERMSEIQQKLVRIQNQHQDFVLRFIKQVEHDVFDDIGQNLHAALHFAEDVAEQNSLGSETWRRQQQLLAKHLRNITDKLIDQKKIITENHQRHLEDWARWAAQTAERIETMVELSENDPQLAQQQTTVINELRYHQGFTQIIGSSIQESLQSNTLWRQIAGTPSQKLTSIADELQRLNQTESAEQTVATWRRLDALRQQFTDRRTYQYSRLNANGIYAADLGNAARAAQRILEKSYAVSRQEDTPKQVEQMRQIANAMKTLEIDQHLTHALSYLSQLKNREQFRRQSFAARNESPRQWEALTDQLNQANELAAPAKLVDSMRHELAQLRWAPEVGQAGNLISPRRWDVEQDASAVAALDQLNTRIKQTRERLEPAFAEARAFLVAASPTISQLARQAADAAKKQQEKAESAADEQRQATIPNLDQRMQQRFEEQFSKTSGQTQLNEKLRDTASSQDLMDAEQQVVAKDADISQALTQRLQQLIVQAMLEISQANETDAAESLDKLAKKEEQAARILSVIANHFEKLNPDHSLDSATTDSLAEAANELRTDDQQLMDKYRQAEALAELSNQSEDELLEQLEAELQRSEEMQGELSEISQAIAKQAKSALERAAADEQKIKTANENSDQQFEFQKQQLKANLDDLAADALDVAHRVHHDATDSARRLSQDETATELQEAAHELYEAANTAKQTKASQPVEELKTAATQLSAAADVLLPKIQQLQKQAEQKKGETPHEDENQWARARDEMQRIQDRIQQDDIRRADNLKRKAQQEVNSEKRELQRRKQEVQQAEKRVAEAEKRVEKNENAQWLQEQLTEQRIRQAEAVTKRELAAKSVKQQEQRSRLAEQKAQSVRQRQLPELNGSNPTAEMSEALAQRVKEATQSIAEAAKDLGGQQSWQDELQTSRQRLNASQQDQEQTTKAVDQIASDLQRAAKHQNRLNHSAAGDRLKELADEVALTKQESVDPAGESMQAASKTENPIDDRQADSQQSNQIQNQLQQAAQALQQHAAELGKQIAEKSGSQAQSQDSQVQPSASPSQPDSAVANPAMQVLSAAEKARMLDQLTQSAPSQANPPNPTEGQANQVPEQLAQNAEQLAAKLNQQRQANSPATQPSLQQRMAAAIPGRDSQAFPTVGPLGQVSAVRTIDIDKQKLDGNWSQLREQAADDVVETQRETVAPRYRKQVENYFKILSQQRK